MLKAIGSEYVEIRAFGAVAKVPFQLWLRETDAAIRMRARSIEAGNAKPMTPAETFAAQWLKACGLRTQKEVNGYLERRALLDAPPDAPKTVHCALCGRLLSDKISVALGTGPECRAKTK